MGQPGAVEIGVGTAGTRGVSSERRRRRRSCEVKSFFLCDWSLARSGQPVAHVKVSNQLRPVATTLAERQQSRRSRRERVGRDRKPDKAPLFRPAGRERGWGSEWGKQDPSGTDMQLPGFPLPLALHCTALHCTALRGAVRCGAVRRPVQACRYTTEGTVTVSRRSRPPESMLTLANSRTLGLAR